MQALADCGAVDGVMFVSPKQISFVVFPGAELAEERKRERKILKRNTEKNGKRQNEM